MMAAPEVGGSSRVWAIRAVALVVCTALLTPLASPAGAVTAPPGFVVENAFPGVTFTTPIQTVFLPDGRKLVVEKTGRVWTMLPDGTQLPTPFIDLRTEVLGNWDLGLMCIALDPDFETNRWVYFLYTVDSDYPTTIDLNNDTFSRLTRYQVSLADPNVVDLTTRQVLIGATWPEGIPSLSNSHTVGALCFGTDKSLLVSTGDGAEFSFVDPGGSNPLGFGPGKNDPAEEMGAFRARSLNSLCGKVLRIDKETGFGLPSNPYWDGDPISDRSRIWLYGLRNPYRISMRPGTGSTDLGLGNPGTLYIGDTGWFTYEEADVAESGGMNFGWPCEEGPIGSDYQAVIATASGNTDVLCSAPLIAENPTAPTGPTIWWHHLDPALSNPVGWTGDTSISGPFYDGTSYPLSYRGMYFVGEWEENWINFAGFDAGNNLVSDGVFLTDADGPVDIRQDPLSGDLYYCAIKASEVRRIRFTGDEVVAETTGLCISPTSTCVSVPVVFNRVTTDDVRSASVTIQLSPELQLCGGGIQQGTWLSGFNDQFFVVDNGGGSYTIDQAILGSPCGVTTGGEMFTVEVEGIIEGIASITVTEVLIRGCSNEILPGVPGAPGDIPVDSTGPDAVADLSADQVKTGNGTSGLTGIQISFTVPADAAVVEVYRAEYGNYPEYDDSPGAGATPPTPAYPPPAPWALTAVTSSGEVDTPGGRDYWYYVVFTWDACGNISAVSNQTTGTLNYHLGDVADGISGCVGDNAVGTADVSFLGANYGIALGAGDPLACLDVGPTADFSVDALPTTDNNINFEDLILFAINFGGVSKALPPVSMDTGSRDELSVETAGEVIPGRTITSHLFMRGSGRVLGLSARLSWDSAVVKPVGFQAGSWLQQQGGVALSPEPGTIDGTRFNTSGKGLEGEGELAALDFRVIGTGDPAIRLAEVDARDIRNRAVEIQHGIGEQQQQQAPTITALLPAQPNPFRRQTALAFTLARSGQVELSVYSVDGRKQRTLIRGVQNAGIHNVVWDGLDEGGARVPTGVYYARLVTAQGTQSQPLTLVKW
jgi:glucose/arabinose dehydrogenase